MDEHDIAIEIDGPSHFVVCEDGSLEVSGTTHAKHRVLRKESKHFFQVTGNLAFHDVNNFDSVMESIQSVVI